MRYITGDILFRKSGAKGPFGIPFSFLVQKLTRSRFSHASIAIVENQKAFAIEVNENGTQKLPIEEWYDYCQGDYCSIYRVKNANLRKVEKSIYDFLEMNPEYDFTFSQEGKFYCVESVVYIYKQTGINIGRPAYVKDILTPCEYKTFCLLNDFVRVTSGKFIPIDRPHHFVGNERIGLMSSPHLYKVGDYDV